MGANSILLQVDLGFGRATQVRAKLHGTSISRDTASVAYKFLQGLEGREVRVLETGPIDRGLRCVRVRVDGMPDLSTAMIERGFLNAFRPKRGSGRRRGHA